MTKIVETIAPRDNRGDDPNDWRDCPDYLERLRMAQTQSKNPTEVDMSWTEQFTVSEAEAMKIDDPEWIFDNLIVRGHVVAIPAPPNGGKTTILTWIASQIANDYQVFYVNADISNGDAKSMVLDAKNRGFTLMLPDMKVGLSMDDVVSKLREMNESEADYSRLVFIFDTLKKMTDVINKARAKELYKVLRGLSAKGMTIVLLAHTNKYDAPDGKPIYEGTGDLRSDVDDLIYLIPRKNDDGSMMVSTEPDKVRAKFSPITFHISANREVSLSDYVDVATLKAAERNREADETVIEAISEAIQAGKVKQIEITTHCKEQYDIGWRTVEKVLDRYRKPPIKLWLRQRAFEKNAWIYQLEK